MEVHMANLLVGSAPVVLEDVVLLGARSHDKLLDDRLRIDISVNAILLSNHSCSSVYWALWCVPGSRTDGRRGCPSTSRRGSWE
jgi:hypothetical protein